jgi:hypothetical protein
VLAENGGGVIVNLLSILGWVAVPSAGTYSASKAKAAAWFLTNSLRTWPARMFDIVNRKKGAGSRDLLDQKLREAGVPADSVNGYYRAV